MPVVKNAVGTARKPLPRRPRGCSTQVVLSVPVPYVTLNTRALRRYKVFLICKLIRLNDFSESLLHNGRASPARYMAYTLRFDGSRDEYSATRTCQLATADTAHTSYSSASVSDSTPTDESCQVKRSRTTNLTWTGLLTRDHDR